MLNPMTIEVIRARIKAIITDPWLSAMMRPETLRPKPVNENVPTINPAAANRIATGIMFLAPAIIAMTMFLGVSQYLRSLLKKLVAMTVTMAQIAPVDGGVLRASRTVKTMIEIR